MLQHFFPEWSIVHVIHVSVGAFPSTCKTSTSGSKSDIIPDHEPRALLESDHIQSWNKNPTRGRVPHCWISCTTSLIQSPNPWGFHQNCTVTSTTLGWTYHLLWLDISNQLCCKWISLRNQLTSNSGSKRVIRGQPTLQRLWPRMYLNWDQKQMRSYTCWRAKCRQSSKYSKKWQRVRTTIGTSLENNSTSSDKTSIYYPIVHSCFFLDGI